MDRRQELTEMAYRISNFLNEERVKEGQSPLPKEEVDRIALEFVEAKLASEAEAKRKNPTE